MKSKLLFILPICLAFAAVSTAQITFSNRKNLLKNQNVHSGVAMAIADMNGDGLDDVVRLDEGVKLQIEYQTAPNQTFETLDIQSFGFDPMWGIAIADLDNNGFNDIMLGGDYNIIGVLMANQNGTDYSYEVLDEPGTFVQTINLVDMDNDGWLDAFVCHDDGTSRIFTNDGTGVLDYAPNTINLATTPPSDNSGNYGSVWSDLNNDGYPELYIAKCRQNVSDPTDGRRINQLFWNNGDGAFTQDLNNASGLRIGWQSWTADFGDIDNDGDMDCFVTNHDATNQLLENDGQGHFTDITTASGLNNLVEGLAIQGFFRDFDNDGWMDILVAGGNFPGGPAFGFPYLLKNQGNKTFQKVPGLFGDDDLESCALGDLNHDGFVDVYGGYAEIFNSPSLDEDALWMSSGNSNHWLGVALSGKESNKKGVGARLSLHTPQGIQIREIRAGEGYGITNSLAVQFGMGANTTIDSLVIKWPSGHRDAVKNLSADQYITVEEGGCVIEQVNIVATGPTTFCSGDSVKISAPVGFPSYLWSNGATTASIFAKTGGIYNVTVTAATGCSAVSGSIRVIVDPDETPVIEISGDSILCKGSSVTLTASGGTAWTWSNGATTKSINVSAAGTYSVTAQGVCKTYSSAPVKIEVLTPEKPTVTGDVTWVNGSATLLSTGDQPQWFDAASGGNLIAVGNTFQTPPLPQTTTFWVKNLDIFDEPNAQVGPVNHSGTAFGPNDVNGQIIFDCEKPFRLKSVKCYTTTAGQRKILLLDADGNELQNKTVNIPTGSPTVTLDLDIPVGEDLVLTTDGNTNLLNFNTISPRLRRNDSNVNYPYTVPGVVTLKSSDAPLQPLSYYYYFYDWVVDFYGHECLSEAVPCVATVDPNMVGTEDFENASTSFSVIPNPATDEIRVQTEGFFKNETAVKLLDARGKLIRREIQNLAPDGSIFLKINDLPAGMYWLEISDGQRKGNGRFVKE